MRDSKGTEQIRSVYYQPEYGFLSIHFLDIDAGINIFNFDKKESSDIEAAWEIVSSGNFFEHQLEEEND